MVLKVYISNISGNHEIRSKQQRVLFILSSLKIDFEEVDITEMGKESEREFMREQCKLHGKSSALPPQFFQDKDYLGDFVDFENANEVDELRSFLKIEDTAESDGDEFCELAKNQGLPKVDSSETEALQT